MRAWEPGKPWTHPSVQRLSDTEIEAKIEDLSGRLRRDRDEFADHPDRAQVSELLKSYRAQMRTYREALRDRQEAAALREGG